MESRLERQMKKRMSEIESQVYTIVTQASEDRYIKRVNCSNKESPNLGALLSHRNKEINWCNDLKKKCLE